MCRVSLVAHHLHDLAANVLHPLAGDALVVGVGDVWVETLPAVSLSEVDEGSWRGRAVRRNNRAKFQTVPSPPFNIGLIAKCADHQHASALFRVGFFAREDRHLREVAWRHCMLTKQSLVSLVVGVRGNSHTCGNQLRASR